MPLINKPKLLNDILQETEELIKIFVTSIKTAVRQAVRPPRQARDFQHAQGKKAEETTNLH